MRWVEARARLCQPARGEWSRGARGLRGRPRGRLGHVAAAVAATVPEATAAAAVVAVTAPEATAAAAAVAAGAPGSVALPTNLQPAPHHGQMGRFHVHRVPLAGQLVAQPLALATASAPAPPGDAPLPMSGDDSHGCGDIRAAMEAHAHSLRRQGTYVGQVALVLFCMSRGVRLHVWEGGTRTDLVSLYAPHLESSRGLLRG